jgi:hypothetical protein
MQRIVLVGVLGIGATACVTTKAAAPIERPALEVPPVPPRVVEAAPAPEAERIEPVPELAPAPPGTTASKPRPSAPRETQKPDTKPETPPPPDPPVVAAPAPAATPPPTLRTSATADAPAVERQIREALRRARGGLQSVDYQRLSQDRKQRYDEANDFINGAEDAIKKANFELGRSLAEKAEKYARELQSR